MAIVDTAGGGDEIIKVEKPSSRRLSVLATNETALVGLEDHFTLPTSSNLVWFRTKKNVARVYESKGVQIVMEEIYDQDTKQSRITVCRLSNETFGVQFLCFLYSIVCALFRRFLFVLCLQMLLFLVLDLAVESGATKQNTEVPIGATIGVVLAIIVFVNTFFKALVIPGHYIVDMWTGHFLA